MPEQLSFAQARRRGPRLAVLPDAARAEQRLLRLVRAAAAGGPGGFVAGKMVCTVAELERELVREAQRSGTCPQLASAYDLQLALREAARDHSEGPYFAIRDQAGYAKALGDLLAALGEGLLDPAALASLDVPERCAALARTLLAARRMLDRAGLADPHRALLLAVEHLERSGALPPSLAGKAEVEFDCVLDWTPLRLRLSTALAGRLRVRIRLPWSAGRPDLTEALDPVLRQIEKLPEPAPDLELFDPAEAAPALAPWLRALFSRGEPAPGAPVELFCCASPLAQAREVARRCAALVEAGVSPDAIAIASRSLGNGVAEELGAALERAGIPWRERRGRPALQGAPVRLALSVLELADAGFPREPLIELLCSGLLRLSGEGDRLPPHAVARALREAHATDDLGGGYAQALGSLARRLEKKGLDSAHVEEASRRVRRLLSELRALPAQGTLREHGSALLDLLARWGLFRRLRAPGREEGGPALERAASSALARDQAAARALEQACAGLARAASRLGDVRLTRGEFAQLLSQALATASLPPGAGARGGAVQLLEVRELPGRELAHLFVVGLVDGELPARPAPDPLLSDEERLAVNRAARRPVFRVAAGSPEAGVLPPRQAEEPLLFHLALCSARRSIALSWPRTDARDRDVLRSPFADEAERAAGKAADLLPLDSIAAASACPDAGSLLARAALDAFSDPAYRITPPAPESSARPLASALLASPLAARFRRIARAAAAERERVRAFVGEIPAGPFSGQLSGPALEVAASAFAFGPAAPASAHQLEDHAACGFRTLGKRLLRIDVDDRDDAELGPRERGVLLHLCLERFFRRLRAEGRLPLRGAPEEAAILREVAEAAMDEFAEREHVGNPALWELRRAELLEALIAVVEADAGAEPVELERRFGFEEEDSWPPLRVGDVHVRGVIDRVDRMSDGSLLVLDYKSSRVASLNPRLKPEALLAPEFQLALYAEMLRQREPGARVDAAYLSLRDAARTRTLRQSGIDPDSSRLAAGVRERVAKMRSGQFAVRPLSCEYCDLDPACRLVALPTDPEENGGEVPRG